jgi:L-aminopeptidase/D-esterase-like protein
VGAEPALPAEGRIGGHTTICAIATNARLDKAGAERSPKPQNPIS